MRKVFESRTPSKDYDYNSIDTEDPIKETLPYKQKHYLLSKAELNFYLNLRNVLDEKVLVMCKVDLKELIYVGHTAHRQSFFNKISKKNIDFVICNEKLQPLVLLELDDSSHNREDRIQRDIFLNELFSDLALDLLHVPVSNAYAPSELKNLIKPYIDLM